MRLADHLMSLGRRPEIVSADSLCIYKELEIGTAKPSREDRKRVRHHLIDIRSVRDAVTRETAYSAGEFAKDFFKIAPSLPDPVLVVGGTAFYIDAIVRGLAVTPTADAEIRERLASEEAARPGAVYERLCRLDPAAARKIGPANFQRLIRAVEVCEIAGGKFSEKKRSPTNFNPVVFVLTGSRADLYCAIDDRTRQMFSQGLPDEVESILKSAPPDHPALASIGYAEAVQLVRGNLSREDAIARAATRSRQLAKRQLTWWRNFSYEQLCLVPAQIDPDLLLDKWKSKND